MSYELLPSLNASLNAAATVLLVAGRWAALRHRVDLHNRIMIAALLVSALFLVSYLTYHALRTQATGVGHTAYPGTGLLRGMYYFILFTHIPLAGLVVPACLAAVYRGLKGQIDRHRRIVRWLWPVWIYVSVTGVLIYLMLYQLPGGL